MSHGWKMPSLKKVFPSSAVGERLHLGLLETPLDYEEWDKVIAKHFCKVFFIINATNSIIMCNIWFF
jgi:hypothetical protein